MGAVAGAFVGLIVIIPAAFIAYKIISHIRFQRWVKQCEKTGFPWDKQNAGKVYPMTYSYDAKPQYDETKANSAVLR